MSALEYDVLLLQIERQQLVHESFHRLFVLAHRGLAFIAKRSGIQQSAVYAPGARGVEERARGIRVSVEDWAIVEAGRAVQVLGQLHLGSVLDTTMQPGTLPALWARGALQLYAHA